MPVPPGSMCPIMWRPLLQGIMRRPQRSSGREIPSPLSVVEFVSIPASLNVGVANWTSRWPSAHSNATQQTGILITLVRLENRSLRQRIKRCPWWVRGPQGSPAPIFWPRWDMGSRSLRLNLWEEACWALRYPNSVFRVRLSKRRSGILKAVVWKSATTRPSTPGIRSMIS